ncbi:MAG: hypothetical protein OEW67_10725, partial [Cyclobacteriaceae bacterium]|nr:hypothetical protein [Cyclobacteriaceae bacterium]
MRNITSKNHSFKVWMVFFCLLFVTSLSYSLENLYYETSSETHNNNECISTETEIVKKITICHIPPGNPDNPQTIRISEKAWPAHEAHGDSRGECVIEDPIINICHDGENIEIKESEWDEHEAHGDYKGECTVEVNDPLITICHFPVNNPNDPITIEIAESAWPAHEAHGDSRGECVNEDPIINICHEGENIEIKE